MSKDYTGLLDELAPGAATPEVTINDNKTRIEAALTEISAQAGEGGGGGGEGGEGSGLPSPGAVGQFLALVAPTAPATDPVPAWVDAPKAEGGTGGTGGSESPTGYGAHKYWRIFMRGGSGYYAYTIAQLDFLDKNGIKINVGGGSYLDSNANRSDSNSADKAFDNDGSTFWQGKGENQEMVFGPSYLGYVFPNAVSVYGVKITARNTGGGAEKQIPNDCVLQFSDDGKSWIGALSFGGNSDFNPSESRAYNSIYSTIFDPTAPVGPHTSWRVRVVMDEGGAGRPAELDSLQFRSVKDTAEAVSGGTIIFSSETSGSFASYAFDDTHNSSYPGWKSDGAADTTTQWIGYTFASAKTVAQVSMQKHNEGGPREFYVEYCDGDVTNEANWHLALHVENQFNWTFTETRTFNIPTA